MSQRFTEEFKIQAVKQVTEHGHSVSSVSVRLGITASSLYNWMKVHGPDSDEHKKQLDHENKIKQLEKELKRVTMERDILKEATVFFAGESKKNTRS
ncbi:transposase [Oleiphilus sp. HI0081]|nr:transposase [Oleiphilus sp. HI0043]KZY43160.1 transposase [Oleiphilus sp. HI0050]KZY58639.1 transposase [Oleiphilus sp. HI0061]KZY74409.1 transposase [Oleiphilus sp. HI0068]KZY81446.1 transposase [Oleiphilus sp. HI0069]KZY88342.1 transposase [Oleiphilus sp. HI0072]KZZ20295.1 transposase [Oleiphilus sp. HI0081]KZZ33823.1 transposase [Oleiphilus sp. HI0085]KZZ35731.1 transposase [Oleiphilus sp. HI0117]KZZ39323.1 transposase [Oleiphilus sp. HI0086]KZZ56870.1 transposase [Oleiphilus sp. HI